MAWAMPVVVALLCELFLKGMPLEKRKAYRIGLYIGPVGVYAACALFLTALVIKALCFGGI
jgi:hypothetical protein